jgi:hypothetical protein
MKVKYRNKVYNSMDIPLFFYFKNITNKNDFINFLANNSLIKEYKRVSSVHVILAGNAVIKDKRAGIYISFDEKEEKKHLQKSIFFNPEDSNAFLCSPPDIGERNLEVWLEKNLSNLK